MKLLANAVAYLAVTSFAVLPNIAMSAEPVDDGWLRAAVPRVLPAVGLAAPLVRAVRAQALVVAGAGGAQQAEQQQAEQPAAGAAAAAAGGLVGLGAATLAVVGVVGASLVAAVADSSEAGGPPAGTD